MNLFDHAEAERRKQAGMAQAAAARADLLRQAQEIAVQVAAVQGEVTSDDVALRMEQVGLDYEALGNAAGSVFRGRFEWTGRVTQSCRVSTHGRVIRVWRVKP